MATQLCYNRGCGREFKVKDNHDEACTFHPGAPYFHDAYKGWTCCQNKSTDFTTFQDSQNSNFSHKEVASAASST